MVYLFIFLFFNVFYIFFLLGEVAKLFADAGLICIASLISPYRKDRDSCRALLPDASFIEVGGFVIVSIVIALVLF